MGKRILCGNKLEMDDRLGQISHVFVKRGDRPKTQKSILKVVDNTKYVPLEESIVVSENDFSVCLDIKVENDDQSKIVFGQPKGGLFVHLYSLEITSNSKLVKKFSNVELVMRWRTCLFLRKQSIRKHSLIMWIAGSGLWKQEECNMRVPLPCRFGDLAECKGKLLPLCGVSRFQCMKGMEFTYFFK